jgi:hypothetical protein
MTMFNMNRQSMGICDIVVIDSRFIQHIVISPDKYEIVIIEIPHQSWIRYFYILKGILDQLKYISIEDDFVDIMDISYSFYLHDEVHLIPLECPKIITGVYVQIR